MMDSSAFIMTIALSHHPRDGRGICVKGVELGSDLSEDTKEFRLVGNSVQQNVSVLTVVCICSGGHAP